MSLMMGLFLLPDSLLGQGHLPCLRLAVHQFPLALDSLIVEPGSIRIQPDHISHRIDKGNLLVLEGDDLPDSIEVCYRTLSPRWKEPFYLRDIRTYEPASFANPADLPVTRAPIKKEEVFATPGLYKSGSITRGITTGNQQDLYVNSGLNLQLQGALTDQLNIRAVITDQNVPFQPEGNTQQLRDFDNVLIQLYNERMDLQAGDIVLSNPADYGYFLKYYKNQQGMQFRLTGKQGRAWSSSSHVSAALAKGKFSSVQLAPIEGIPGPYKLRSGEGERFVIVLANSEKVYLDGRLLRRGFDQDYIIDYNLGEITFNPSILITRFSRIRVDFEYVQQAYLRSNLLVSHEAHSDRARVYVSHYREKDNASRPLFFDLADENYSVLADLGDQASQAFIPGADSIGYTDSRIVYEKMDTIQNGVIYPVFVHSTNPSSAHFLVTFTEVGPGQGDYVLVSSTSNGRIYQWLPPQGGISQGNFAPVRQVVLPNQRQLTTVGGELKLGRYFLISHETAISSQDKNLYSDLDDKDNTGLASMSKVAWQGIPLGGDAGYRWSGNILMEWDHAFFLPIDRYRTVEFDRDWNYPFPYDSLPATDRMVQGTSTLSKDKDNRMVYSVVARQRSQVLAGWQQALELRKKLGPVTYSGQHMRMKNQVLGNQSEWNRSFSELYVGKSRLQSGVFVNLDQNTLVSPGSGRVMSSAMYFYENGFFLRNGDSTTYHLTARAAQRTDQLPLLGELKPYTSARQVEVNYATPTLRDHHVSAGAIFRSVEEKLLQDTTTQIVQGRLMAVNHFLDQHVRSSLSYASSNGRELRREYIFTQVGSGQGTHTWRDENGDGLQDLNEFYEAINPDERQYIKLFVPTDSYMEAYQVLYQHSVDISFPSDWTGSGFWLDKIARLAFSGSWNINQKTTSPFFIDRINPFAVENDSLLVSGRNTRRYTLFYNRALPGMGFSLGKNKAEFRQLNQNGFEAQSSDLWTGAFRWNLNARYQWNGTAEWGHKISQSDFLISRNMALDMHTIQSKLSWQPNSMFRLAGGYVYKQKVNVWDENSNEHARHGEVFGEVFVARAQQGTFNSRFSYSSIRFQGEPNTYVGYTLLEALQPGANYRLTANWQQTLQNGLQLTLQYFGRKSGTSPVIHSGNVSVTAFF